MPINHLAPVSIRRTTAYRHQNSRRDDFSISNLHQRFFSLLNYFTIFFCFYSSLYSLSIFFQWYSFFSFLSISQNSSSSKLFRTIFFDSFLILSRSSPNDLSFDNIPSQRFNFSKLSHDSFSPFSLDSNWYFLEESSPRESYLEGKKFYHPLSNTLLLRFPFADEGNVYALATESNTLPNLRTFFSPRWWPTETIHVRHAFFHQRCFTLSLSLDIYILYTNLHHSFIFDFIAFLLSHLHFSPRV